MEIYDFEFNVAFFYQTSGSQNQYLYKNSWHYNLSFWNQFFSIINAYKLVN